ncbi:hypothetical protein NDU88_007390 [Pleurodeles waltl]|uniref:Uncharacterized protein n=1 Tax=Pleurodeles waltl TaxID=8319 RepID=A0AAV7QLP2_PLEWA|nr:hypothetical protein NDU88_007390 [Pleurodeles waltl]
MCASVCVHVPYVVLKCSMPGWQQELEGQVAAQRRLSLARLGDACLGRLGHRPQGTQGVPLTCMPLKQGWFGKTSIQALLNGPLVEAQPPAVLPPLTSVILVHQPKMDHVPQTKAAAGLEAWVLHRTWMGHFHSQNNYRLPVRIHQNDPIVGLDLSCLEEAPDL